MASHSESEDDQFFDTPDDIASVSDFGSNCSDDFPTSPMHLDGASNDFSYEFWTRTPESVHQRRSRFFEKLDLSSNENEKPIRKEDEGDVTSNEIKIDIDRINLDSGAVLRNSNSENSLFSHRSSSRSCSSTEEEFLGDYALENNFVTGFNNLDIGRDLNMDGIGKNAVHLGLNKLVLTEKVKKDGKNNVNSWLKKLRSKVHNTGAKREQGLKSSPLNVKEGDRLRRTRVRSHKKRTKELSSLFEGQNFRAHEGSIYVMKFSPDGQFLASAGEDGVVRVWKVIEVERNNNNLDIRDIDPLCLYFSLNHCSKLVPLDFGRDKNLKTRRLKKSTKPSCVILPPRDFRIAEEPLHEFRGHCGEVLALSWSNNQCLLSSSVDKTVRLWQVGQDECLGVFSHNNYVTCVEFNPIDDNYFISGSIDGKIRIWEMGSCRVVDWIDIRDIVTAVSYYPNGKRGLVGSMDGSCRFYDIIDNQLQLDTQIFLQGKKKLPCKRITGFQFSPSNLNEVLITSADAQVRVLRGTNVIFKLKGPRMSGTHVTAAFTEDGKHIVSGSEDSYIHVWDHASLNTSPSKAKSIGSRESFISSNTSTAIPWYGMKTKSSNSSIHTSMGNELVGTMRESLEVVPSSSPDCFGLFMDSWSRGPATWPEEKLLDSSISPSVCRSEFKVLKSACENMSNSHMWGLVIVTAGHDGWIKTFHNYGLPIQL